MVNLIIGIVLGTVFSPFLIRLWKYGWKKLDKNVADLEEK